MCEARLFELARGWSWQSCDEPNPASSIERSVPMKKTLALVALLGFMVVFINGCRAEGEINPKSGSVSTEIEAK